jgi:hypothetical protein
MSTQEISTQSMSTAKMSISDAALVTMTMISSKRYCLGTLPHNIFLDILLFLQLDDITQLCLTSHTESRKMMEYVDLRWAWFKETTWVLEPGCLKAMQFRISDMGCRDTEFILECIMFGLCEDVDIDECNIIDHLSWLNRAVDLGSCLSRVDIIQVLTASCMKGYLSVAKWLCGTFGITAVEAKGDKNESAIYIGCSYGHLQLAQCLVETLGITLNWNDDQPHVMVCFLFGRLEVVKWLFNQAFEPITPDIWIFVHMCTRGYMAMAMWMWGKFEKVWSERGDITLSNLHKITLSYIETRSRDR